MADAQLGRTLRDLREQAGMSQEELAAKAQVSRASIQNWEAARTAPRRAESRRLAAALGVSVDDLKARTGEERVDAQEIRDALQAAMELEDAEEMRAALLELLARMPPASEQAD
jgi:transcriptional regulator with XRE-family HTH domain